MFCLRISKFFHDYRSLKATGSSDNEAAQRANAALAVTAAFDEAVGFCENAKKH